MEFRRSKPKTEKKRTKITKQTKNEKGDLFSFFQKIEIRFCS